MTTNNNPYIWSTDTTTDYNFNGGNMSVTFPSTSYDTVTISDSTSPWIINDALTSSAKITLSGENADIEIGDKSLMKILDGIERRLGLLELDHELEQEFDELRKIGDEYRAKEKELLEKRKMWETLKR